MMMKDSGGRGWNSGYAGNFLFGAIFGGLFGIVADIVYLLLGYPNSIVIYIMMPIGAMVISGLAGMGGVVIENLLAKTRVAKQPFLRMMISFFILATIVIAIPSYFLIRTPFNTWEQYYWGASIGCGFGLIIAIINYQIDKMRQKVIKLETENQFLNEIAAKDLQLQETAKNLMIAEERNRMARELHDSISQGIHGIIYTVHSLRKQMETSNEKTKELVNYLEDTAEATLSELRAMILELKPTIMEAHGLTEAIRLQSELFARRQHFELDMDLKEVRGLSPEQEMAIYRIVQESLTNIQRHSEAKRIRLVLTAEPDNRVLLSIVDDGKGFDIKEIRQGNGLRNMAVRCRENGGSFQIHSRIGQGTSIEARFNI
jgi:NarL family two-component system sensor histidine kinase LiaS